MRDQREEELVLRQIRTSLPSLLWCAFALLSSLHSLFTMVASNEDFENLPASAKKKVVYSLWGQGAQKKF